MKKFSWIIAILAIVCFASVGLAADSVLETTISQMKVFKNKNGETNVRFIVPIVKNLNGMSYDDSLPVMVFSEALIAQAQTYKEGDTLKAIVSHREFKGRQSMIVKKFIE
jgi:hypothetical protein